MQSAALVKEIGAAAWRPSLTRGKANDLAWGITLAGAWVWTWRQLSLTWSADPSYGFGYFVPWIAVLLACRQIAERPGCLARVAPSVSGRRFFLIPGALAAWGVFLLAELMREFDPHWRMEGWMMMVSVTLLTGIELWRRGGMGLLGPLAFPLGFTWTAVPWTTRIEELITMRLRTFVTKETVAGLHLSGIPAVRHGNIIDLANGSVAVDSACSGISSLQVSIMASLFLGEYFRLRAGKRLGLLAMSSLLAVAGNLLRTGVLLRLANHGGPAEMRAYHDRVGLAETAGIFLALVLGAWACSLRPAARPKGSGTTPRLAGAPQGTEASDLSQKASHAGIFGGNEGWAVLLAFASMPLITSAWFAISPGGPIRAQNAPLWLLRASPLSPDWRIQPVGLSPDDIRTLSYTEGQTISVAGPSNAGALVYHFYWKTDASTGFGHTPDNCMRGAGWREQGEPEPITMRIGGAEFPSKVYRFKRDGEDEVVFQSVWYGGDPMLSMGEFPYAKGGPRTSRLAMLWQEPRRRGVESLTLYMPPAGNADAQRAEEILAQVVVRNRDE